ncbi:MAG: hypothetical protein ACI8T1_002749 [Verrucomicrobiales bacterium]|jgi:uncharacterized protein (DUF1501 family)
MKTTRRDFITRASAAGVISLGGFAPTFLNRAAGAANAAQPAENGRDRILVLIELAGGNDGLNTVIPFADDRYHSARPGIRLSGDTLLKLDDYHALHPQMTGMKSLYDAGHLAVVQGVGYPNPDRSHFRSMDIWHSARPDDEEFRGDGWIGRALDETHTRHGGKVPAMAIGTERLPRALLGTKINVPMLRRLDAFKWNPGTGSASEQQRRRQLVEAFAAEEEVEGSTLDFLRKTTATASQTAKQLRDVTATYKPAAEYPNNDLGEKLKTVAQLIAADLGTQIYYVSLGGFDTHSQQQGAHAALLGELSSALTAFHQDLEGHQLSDRVLAATFSEFGRRVEENGSLGSDHGTASQMFVVTPSGGQSKSGLVGKHPSLTDLDSNDDMKFHTDFRAVYTTLLEKWLDFPAEAALGGRFKPLDFI